MKELVIIAYKVFATRKRTIAHANSRVLEVGILTFDSGWRDAARSDLDVVSK
jgi:hypothetical protein